MMFSPDTPLPVWIKRWLGVAAFILYLDGSFCVLRPHSLPGGCLETFYLPYKLYIQVDKHYADPKDTLVFVQGMMNFVEASINVAVLLQLFASMRWIKLMAIASSVMTCWKSFIFLLCSYDIADDNRHVDDWFYNILLIFTPTMIFVLVPFYVAYTLMKDFAGKGKREKAKTVNNDETDAKVEHVQRTRYLKWASVDDAVTVSTKTKLLTLVVTTMTFWKTVLYFLIYYNMDFRKHNSFLQEFILIFCLNGIWVLVPFLYKYYYEVDRMYGDLKDSFVYAQALCNWLEVILNLVCLYLNSKISKMISVDDAVTVSTKTKLLTLIVTTMTFWKTVLYFLVYYNMDFRKNNSFLQEFILIFCLNGIWVLVPFLCMKYIFQELCGVKTNSNHWRDERKKL